jgi:hypothetical protein
MIAALLALAVAGAAGCSSANPPATAPTPATSAPGGGFPTNWPLPADPSAAAQAAGLEMLGNENLQVHYHSHLDINVRDTKITVPANIGIDTKKRAITALHTHDPSGIIHIESASDVPFTLGQLFTEWGQPLSANQIGPVKAAEGEQVRLYRNGTQVEGDPAAYTLKPHDELVLWLGPANAQPSIPSSYAFPPGL